ncbi:Quinate/shikimate dehydrogenase [compost metagenome]
MDKLPGLPLDVGLLRPDMWVSEVVYFPLETALVQAARALGCRVSDGGGMAVGQAVGAFELFTGVAPDPARMDAHLRQLVTRR